MAPTVRSASVDHDDHLLRGSRFWASGEMMPLRPVDGGPPGFVKVLRDRMEQHRAGRALREAEARLLPSEVPPALPGWQ